MFDQDTMVINLCTVRPFLWDHFVIKFRMVVMFCAFFALSMSVP